MDNEGRWSRPLAYMHRLRASSLPWFALGSALAVLATGIGVQAVAQRPPSFAGAVFETTHLPPLLTLPGERARLTYDVHCAAADVDDPEQSCRVRGVVYLRTKAREQFRPRPLTSTAAEGQQRLTALLTADESADGFEYYAELQPENGDERLIVPAGGAAAPHRSIPLGSPTVVRLGTHSFGSTVRGNRVASARWGDDSLDVGLESGRNAPAIGASAFAVGGDGSVLLLDQAHRRVLRWESDSRPDAIPVSIAGRLADMTVDSDGSIYVLESVASSGRAPLVRRFDDSGRELDAVETAERTPSQIRGGPDGPFVLQQPSHQWMPIVVDGSPASPREQRVRGRNGRPLQHGREVVVLRRDDGILVGLVTGGRVQRSWRITSDTAVAEVQLAEPVGGRLVLVARLYAERADEFVVLVLDGQGLVRRFSLAPADWAESAPLGRFRLAGDFLYRLGSSPTGAFVERFDLEAR